MWISDSSHRNSCPATVINSEKQLPHGDFRKQMQITQMNAHVSQNDTSYNPESEGHVAATNHLASCVSKGTAISDGPAFNAELGYKMEVG